MTGSQRCPLVYAVVLNWNGWRDTIRCLDSLRASGYPALRVVVVDNGSTDDSIERLNALIVQYGTDTTVQQPTNSATQQLSNSATLEQAHPLGPLASSQPLVVPATGGTPKLTGIVAIELLCLARNTGFTGGVSAGLRLALERGAAYAFLLNNDATVEPGCLGTLVEAAEARPDVGLAGPKIVWAGEPGRIWSAGMSVAWRRAAIGAHRDEPDDGRYAGRRLVQGLSGCALLVKRAVLEQVGLLDERYFAYYEDLDWCLRARRAGFRALYVGDARVAHAGSASGNRGAGSSQSAFINYYGARNGLLFMATHAPRTQRPIALACLTARLLAALARVIAGGLALRRPDAMTRAWAIVDGVRDAMRGRFGARDEAAP